MTECIFFLKKKKRFWSIILAHPGGTGIPQELAVVYWSAIALFCKGVHSLLPVHGDWPQQRREGIGFWLLFFCIIIPSSAVVQVFWDTDTKTELGVKDTYWEKCLRRRGGRSRKRWGGTSDHDTGWTLGKEMGSWETGHEESQTAVWF